MYNDFHLGQTEATVVDGPEAWDYAAPAQCSDDDCEQNVIVNVFNGVAENRKRPWDVEKVVCRP